MRLTIVVLLILLLSLALCHTKRTKKVDATLPFMQEQNKSESKTIEEILELSEKFKKEYRIKKDEDLSYKGIVRTQLRITVPAGLTKTEIKNNITDVVINSYKEKRADGISVLVYEDGDNINHAYTVAMGEFAPGGEWNNIKRNVPLSQFSLNIKYRKGYFHPKEVFLKKGTVVRLYKKTMWSRKQKKNVKAFEVPLSRSAEDWTKDFIIVNIPNGTSAKIIDVYTTKIAGELFIRYKVETNYNGKKYTGWVHEDEVKK